MKDDANYPRNTKYRKITDIDMIGMFDQETLNDVAHMVREMILAHGGDALIWLDDEYATGQIVEVPRPETDEEYEARLGCIRAKERKDEEMKASKLKHKLAQFEQLKRELGL